MHGQTPAIFAILDGSLFLPSYADCTVDTFTSAAAQSFGYFDFPYLDLIMHLRVISSGDLLSLAPNNATWKNIGIIMFF